MIQRQMKPESQSRSSSRRWWGFLALLLFSPLLLLLLLLWTAVGYVLTQPLPLLCGVQLSTFLMLYLAWQWKVSFSWACVESVAILISICAAQCIKPSSTPMHSFCCAVSVAYGLTRLWIESPAPNAVTNTLFGRTPELTTKDC